ncbi:MAG TPA: hypothetical protein V6C78_04475 [Crinalium sp.]|jgi:hypothetical protein
MTERLLPNVTPLQRSGKQLDFFNILLNLAKKRQIVLQPTAILSVSVVSVNLDQGRVVECFKASFRTTFDVCKAAFIVFRK